MSAIKDLIQANLPDNNVKAITEAKLREVLEAIDDKVEDSQLFEGGLDLHIIAEIDGNADFEKPLSFLLSDVLGFTIPCRGVKKEGSVIIDASLFDPGETGELEVKTLSFVGVGDAGVFQALPEGVERSTLVYTYREIIDKDGVFITAGDTLEQVINFETGDLVINYAFRSYDPSRQHGIRFEDKGSHENFLRNSQVIEIDNLGNFDVKELQMGGLPSGSVDGQYLRWRPFSNEWIPSSSVPALELTGSYQLGINDITVVESDVFGSSEPCLSIQVYGYWGGDIETDLSSHFNLWVLEGSGSLGSRYHVENINAGVPPYINYRILLPLWAINTTNGIALLALTAYPTNSASTTITTNIVIHVDHDTDSILGAHYMNGNIVLDHLYNPSCPKNLLRLNLSEPQFSGTVQPVGISPSEVKMEFVVGNTRLFRGTAEEFTNMMQNYAVQRMPNMDQYNTDYQTAAYAIVINSIPIEVNEEPYPYSSGLLLNQLPIVLGMKIV